MEKNPSGDPTGVYMSDDDADGESVYLVLTPTEVLSDVDASNAEESGSHSSSVNTKEDVSIPFCSYCKKNHHRRRLILCSDGAAYDFSNAPEQSSNRLQRSSIYTISKVIEAGQVFDSLSAAMIDQITMYRGVLVLKASSSIMITQLT
ncbi:hypothetical protein TWF730_006904 [Orbilia blumenaviensis]|uniref:Uncharacterized protein n=1 Tax=Orbilia blumenaviensis TaxID=1796055 RepID=A0AAV9VH34_9PEZI